MIESILEGLIEKFNREDLNQVRRAMAQYALDAVHDSKVREEAEMILGMTKKASYGEPEVISESCV